MLSTPIPPPRTTRRTAAGSFALVGAACLLGVSPSLAFSTQSSIHAPSSSSSSTVRRPSFVQSSESKRPSSSSSLSPWQTTTSRSSSNQDDNNPVMWPWTPGSATPLEKDSSASSSLPPGLTQIQAVAQPLQSILDDATGGYMLSYADLRPDSSSTPAGQAFLATNLFYVAAGLLVALQGDLWFGIITEITSVASFLYHYNQLEAAGQEKAPAVRLAVLTDYTCAAFSMTTALVYLVLEPAVPWDALGVSAAALGFLGLSWIFETGRTYMVFHSLWHVFSAAAGTIIGTQHAATVAAATTTVLASS